MQDLVKINQADALSKVADIQAMLEVILKLQLKSLSDNEKSDYNDLRKFLTLDNYFQMIEIPSSGLNTNLKTSYDEMTELKSKLLTKGLLKK